MKVSYIVHNNYEKNPLVQYCMSKMSSQENVDIELIQLSDLGDYIERCKHSKEFLEKFGHVSYVTDQVRLLLGMEKPDFCYLDADSFIKNINNVPDNTIGLEAGRINNGALQKGAKEWCEFYYNIYQKDWKKLIYNKESRGILNYEVIQRYPCPASVNYLEVNDTQHKNGRHFVLSNVGRFARINEDRVIYYSWSGKNVPTDRIVWQLNNTPTEAGSFLNRIWYFDCYNDRELFYLWQKQIEHSLSHSCIFIEV